MLSGRKLEGEMKCSQETVMLNVTVGGQFYSAKQSKKKDLNHSYDFQKTKDLTACRFANAFGLQ